MPYETVEVNPLNKREIKPWSGDYRKVPIAMLDGEQINDSPVIASRLLDSMAATDHVPKDQLAAFRSKVGHREGLRIHAHVLPRRDRSASVLLPATSHPARIISAGGDGVGDMVRHQALGASLPEYHALVVRGVPGAPLLLCRPVVVVVRTRRPRLDYIDYIY